MAYATGATAGLSYVAETVFGTTPTTPQMIKIPFVSTTFDLNKDIITDASIISDRMVRDEKHGNRHAAGNVAVTLRHGQYDDLLEAALGGTWTADVLKVAGTTGGTPRSFTFEQSFGDIGQYRQFKGVRVNTFDFNGAQNSHVTSTFGLIGKGLTTATTALDATPTEVQDKTGYTLLDGVLTIDGNPVKCTAVSLSHNNNMTGLFSVTEADAFDINWAEAKTTGSMTFYFDTQTMMNLFLNESLASGVITMKDAAGDTLTFTMPRIKFNTASIPVPGPGVLFVTMSYTALFDPTLGSTFSVTRS